MVKCVGQPDRPWGSQSSWSRRPSLGLVPYQYTCLLDSRMNVSTESLIVDVGWFPWVCDCWASRGVM